MQSPTFSVEANNVKPNNGKNAICEYGGLVYVCQSMDGLYVYDAKDGSLVNHYKQNITNSKYDYLVVKQFTELAHSLNLTVCYEGVETEEVFRCVLDLKPDYIQGYYFSKPIPAAEFEEKCLNRSVDF